MVFMLKDGLVKRSCWLMNYVFSSLRVAWILPVVEDLYLLFDMLHMTFLAPTNMHSTSSCAVIFSKSVIYDLSQEYALCM